MTRLKVVHITTVDISLRYFLQNQLHSLQQAGYDVAGLSAPGTEAAMLERSGIRHIAIPMTRSFTPVADLVSLWKLYRVMRRERFTIVHTHTPKPGLLGQIAARLAGVPIVVNTIHGFYFHDRMPQHWRRFYITMEKIAARCSHAILSQNREDMVTAVRERICPPERMEYLGNGIDLRRFQRASLDPYRLAQLKSELGVPASVPIVGFVGRLVAEKGLLELLQAAQILVRHYPQLRLLIIGPFDNEKGDALTPAIAQRFSIAEHCIFAGMRQDMPELYGIMDVFVLPSHREGFPRSAMEASAMGVPCVVTDIRGCREAVEANRNGLLVPLGDVQALAGAVLDILSHPDKARAMGTEGQRMAAERFDEQLVFAKVKETYTRLLRSKGLALPSPQSSAGALP